MLLLMHQSRPMAGMDDTAWQGSGVRPAAAVGWTTQLEVEASVVTIRNPAAADDEGLVNPILKRFLEGACSLNVRAARPAPPVNSSWLCLPSLLHAAAQHRIDQHPAEVVKQVPYVGR